MTCPDYPEDDLAMFEDGGLMGWECLICHDTYHDLDSHIRDHAKQIVLPGE